MIYNGYIKESFFQCTLRQKKKDRRANVRQNVFGKTESFEIEHQSRTSVQNVHEGLKHCLNITIDIKNL